MNKPISTASVLALACVLTPAGLRGQSTYQGVSHPPSDETIEANADTAVSHAKPSAGVPAARNNSAPATDPDDGIVTSIPTSISAQPAVPAAEATPRASATRLVTRPENPDYGIVGVVPSPSNQLAEGTDIRVRLLQALSTSSTQDGTPFRGQVAADVYKEGRVVIPVGSELRGRVMSVSQGHRMGSPATLRLRPDAVTLPDGTSYHLYAQAIRSDAPGTRTGSEGAIQPTSRVQRNLIELGAGSGGGAATGAIFGGPLGAGVGALVGAGIITAHLLLQHPSEANVEQGSEVVFSLSEPMDLAPTRN